MKSKTAESLCGAQLRLVDHGLFLRQEKKQGKEIPIVVCDPSGEFKCPEPGSDMQIKAPDTQRLVGGEGTYWPGNKVVAQKLFSASCSGILTSLGWIYVCGPLSSMPDLLWWSEELGLSFPAV